jgi:hypothetical protein
MIRRKYFLSFLKEKDWLVHKNRNGYELVSRRGFNYDIKKTLIPVEYEYVFLKKGKKSYKEFDYKSKDAEAQAIYANGDILLLKKPLSKGEISVFSNSTERINNANEKRAALNITAIVQLGCALIISALIKFIPPLRIILAIASIPFIAMSLYNLYFSYQIGKYIKD